MDESSILSYSPHKIELTGKSNAPIYFQGDWQVMQLFSAVNEEEVICFSSPDKHSELKAISLFVLSSADECVIEKYREYLV
jgi:hypothetical protein